MTPPRSRASRVAWWLIVSLGAIASLALAASSHGRLDRELSRLPDAERRALFDRTRETLGGPCSRDPGPELLAHCRRQAELLTRFPECERECRDLAARFAPWPTR